MADQSGNRPRWNAVVRGQAQRSPPQRPVTPPSAIHVGEYVVLGPLHAQNPQPAAPPRFVRPAENPPARQNGARRGTGRRNGESSRRPVTPPDSGPDTSWPSSGQSTPPQQGGAHMASSAMDEGHVAAVSPPTRPRGRQKRERRGHDSGNGNGNGNGNSPPKSKKKKNRQRKQKGASRSRGGGGLSHPCACHCGCRQNTPGRFPRCKWCHENCRCCGW